MTNTNTNKIYDGDVKARVDLAIEIYKSNPNCYFNDTMYNYAQEVKNIDKLYKKSGWKAVSELIADVNSRCWEEYYLGQENVSRFYAELYYAFCAWYQGYPANEYEVEHADEEGCFDHVDKDDMCKIYRYLD